MEDYEVGALGDLISGTKSPGKGKVVQKMINKSPAKGPIGTPRGKQNGKTPQKRKLGVNAKPNAKKARQEEEVEEESSPEEADDQEVEDSDAEAAQEESEDEDAEAAQEESEDEDAEEDGEDAEEEGEDSEESGNIEASQEDSDEDEDDDEEDAEEDDEELEGEEDENSDEDAPEEKSSKPKKQKGDSVTIEVFPERTIFVGNVKVGLQKKVVIAHFKKYGQIESVRFRSIAVANPKLGKKLSIQKNMLHDKRSTCNAYVRFEKADSAEKAVAEENGKEFCGLHIRVTMANDKATAHDNKKSLFVGNLSFSTEDEGLWQTFAPCGEIESVRIVRDKLTDVSKGFAYVNFKSADSVQLAIEMGEVMIDSRVLRLSTSEFSRKERKPTEAPNECCVFAAGFSAGTSKEIVRKAFSEFGEVAKLRLLKDRDTQKQLGCAFITFKNPESMQKALKAQIVKVNNQEVNVQLPRTSLKGAKKAKAAGRTPNNADKSQGRIEKPWKKDGGRGFSRGGRGFSSEGRGFFRGGRGFSSEGRGIFRGGRGFSGGERGFSRGGRGFSPRGGGRGFSRGGDRGMGRGGGRGRGRGAPRGGGRGFSRGSRGGRGAQ